MGSSACKNNTYMRIYGNHFIFPFSDNNNNQFNTQDGKTEATQTATKRSFFFGPRFDDEKTMMPWCSIQADGNRDLLGAINASAIYVRAWFQASWLSDQPHCVSRALCAAESEVAQLESTVAGVVAEIYSLRIKDQFNVRTTCNEDEEGRRHGGGDGDDDEGSVVEICEDSMWQSARAATSLLSIPSTLWKWTEDLFFPYHWFSSDECPSSSSFSSFFTRRYTNRNSTSTTN